MLYFLLFFFFQAEDGIRDRDVTGVQTCALPIYLLAAQPRLLRHHEDLERRAWFKRVQQASEAGAGRTKQRSEERRVGEEGRTGGGGERGKRKRRERYGRTIRSQE